MQSKPRVAIIGVTGFIGRELPAMLTQIGMSTTGVSRSSPPTLPGVDRWQSSNSLDFTGHHAVINLAGVPIARRWTRSNKLLFHESRIGVTHRIADAIRLLPTNERPKVLINTSAIGIYGDRGDEILTEKSRPGTGYLAELCCQWEDAALEVQALGVRLIRLRIGVVLGRDGDAFKKLVFIFKSGIGGKLGSGHQWMSWIHVNDLRSSILHCLRSSFLSGPINATAPAPERNIDFTHKLAAALHRPAILPVPKFALKLALGGFSSALLASQNALPDALISNGFDFQFKTLDTALANLLS